MRIIDDNEDIPYEAERDAFEDMMEIGEEGPLIVVDEGDIREEDIKRLKEKKTYDSDDSSIDRRKRNRFRKRYDSDDDDDDDTHDYRRHDAPKNRLKEKEKRRSYDSDDQSSDKRKSTKRKKRYHSDDASDKDRHKEPSISDKMKRPSKMSSGHSAGLQSATQFRQAESIIQGFKKNDTKALDPGSTVYRDKDGKVIDMNKQPEPSQLQLENDGRWNVGAKQRQEALDHASEKYVISQSAFARSTEDIDKYMRDVARDGDPMANQSTSSSRFRNPNIYKGPEPKPNRFNIRPGYRWDGVDRGNGFEDKVLAKLYSKKSRDEERYKVSCADM